MIHALVSSAEVYLKHKTISQLGGFAVKINGIKIFKVCILLLVILLVQGYIVFAVPLASLAEEKLSRAWADRRLPALSL